MGLQKIWVNRLIAFLSAALLLTVLIPGSSMAQATSAPAQIISVVGGDRVAYITWNKAPDSDYMTWQKVLVYDQPTGGSVVLETQLTDVQTSFVLGPTELLTNGVTYYAEVQSRFNWVYIASSRVAFTPNLAAAAGTESASLAGVEVFNSGAQVYLQHAPSSTVTTYLVAAFADLTTFTATTVIEISASQVKGILSASGIIQGLINNTTPYYFRVAAVNSNGVGPWSTRSYGGVPQDYFLAPPTLLSAVVLDNRPMRAVVEWSAPVSPSQPIVGYRVQFSTNAGLSWTSAPVTTATSELIYVLEGEVPTHFRVAALARDRWGTLFGGAYSNASEPVIPTKRQQIISWSPSTTSAEVLASGISLEPLATTFADVIIQYSVHNAGTAGCNLSIIDSRVEATNFGTCTIRAEAEATAGWTSATRDIEFSFVEPAAIQDPPSQDPPTQDPPTQDPPTQGPPSQQPAVQQPSNEQRGGRNEIVNFPSSAIVPILAEIDFAKPPKLIGESAVGDRIRLSKFQFDTPKKIRKVSYRWYSCEVPVKAEADLESSCVRKSKAKGSSYVIKKSDSGSYLSVVMMAKTKKKMLRHLVSTSSSVPE